MQSNVAHPMKLTVPTETARKLIEEIPHRTCRSAADTNWNASSNGYVPEESTNWLFCWGKTGMGSAVAAREARRVFDAILPISFAEYDAQVDHEYARAHRYLDANR